MRRRQPVIGHCLFGLLVTTRIGGRELREEVRWFLLLRFEINNGSSSNGGARNARTEIRRSKRRVTAITIDNTEIPDTKNVTRCWLLRFLWVTAGITRPEQFFLWLQVLLYYLSIYNLYMFILVGETFETTKSILPARLARQNTQRKKTHKGFYVCLSSLVSILSYKKILHFFRTNKSNYYLSYLSYGNW